MNQERIKKLERVSQQVLGDLIFETIEDSEQIFGIITITGVEISSDLSYLDIWISAFKNKEILAKTLAKHNNEIQSKYNKIIKIRKLPKIRYRYDEQGEIGQRISNTIRDL